MSLNYRIITTRNEFEDIKEEWAHLLSNSSGNSIFLLWEWQYLWWESFGGDLFILLVREDNRIIAILPFIKTYKIFFCILKMIGAPHSDYLDFIIEKGCEKKVLDFFFNCFLNEHKEVKIVELDSINQESPNLDFLLNKVPSSFFRDGFREKECPYIMLPDSWQIYLNSLSASMRYYIGRKERKMEKEFNVQIGLAENRDEVSVRMDHFIEQHQNRWSQRQRPGAFYSDAFCAFHKKVSERFFEKGYLKLYYLELNQKPVASYYLFNYNNAVLFYLSGFDPVYSRYSPGAVLMGRVIRDAIYQGMDEFDFMRGESDYKFKWTTEKRVVITFSLARKTPAVYIYLFTLSILKHTASIIKKTFPVRIKEILRRIIPQWIINTFDPFFRE